MTQTAIARALPRTRGRLLAVETKLLLRDPGSLFAFVIPLFMLLVFGATSAASATTVLPTTLATAIALIGLYLAPTTIATYRERGVLRRLSTTPLSPTRLLTVQLVLQSTLAVVSSGILLIVGTTLLGADTPGNALAFLAALLTGTIALLSCGLLIAALAPNGRAANGIGVLLFFPLAYVGGLIVPPALMPAAVVEWGRFTPLGALRDAMADAWATQTVDLLSLAILAAYAIGVSIAAVKLFRWE